MAGLASVLAVAGYGFFGLRDAPAASASPSVAVVSSSQWGPDSTGYEHVVGEIQNDGPGVASLVQVNLDFYSSTNQLLATDFTYATVDDMNPGDKSPFEDIFAPSGYDHYVISSVDPSSTSNAPNHNFTTTVTNVFVDSIGDTHYVGTVKNNNTTNSEFVNVVFTFYNDSGITVASDFTYVNTDSNSDLGPGQTASFEEVLDTSDQSFPAYINYAVLTQSDTAPSVAPPPPPPPFEVAFNAGGGSLWSVGAAGTQDWGLGIADGSSPSVVRLSNGGYEIAFQSSSGTLWTVGSAGWTNWGVGMAPGTSPSITRLSNGGFEVAFQAAGQALWTVGSAGWTNWGLDVAPRTSPSISGLSNGGYQVAFQAAGQALWTVGTVGWTNWNLGVAPGTSPSITRLSNGGFEASFQAAGQALWTVGSAGWTNWQVGVAPGTSPSISGLTNGGYQVAFQAAGGSLWTVGSAGWNNWGLGVASGSSPSIAGLPSGGFEVAFQANDDSLWTVGSAGWTNWNLGMEPGTNPAEV